MPAEPADDPRWCGRPLAEARWQLELARLIADPVWRGEGVPHGDGRPVLLLPGFLAGDYTLTLLARWLRRIGYRPSTCGFLFNVDCSDRALDLVDGARRGIVALRRARAEQCLTMECTCPFTRDFSASFPRHRVRLTSIYTKADGVVRWERCLVPYADCVEVTGSHTGLVVNRKAYAAIAAALTAPELGGEP